MKTTVTKISGFVFKNKHDGTFFVHQTKGMEEYGYALVGPVEFNYHIPAGFNPVAAEVAALEKKLAKVSDEHMQTVRLIKGQIAELQCIENKPTVTA